MYGGGFTKWRAPEKWAPPEDVAVNVIRLRVIHVMFCILV